jgi:16S rRNA (guanine527-N7)-methyltransferase
VTALHVKHSSASNDLEARLDLFTQLLLRWNATVNLVSARDVAFLRQRHIDDSLQLAPLIPPETERATDLGSGGGFPGLILAIATGVTFDLVESDHRKAAFLREAARVTQASVAVHATRIEDAKLEPAPVVTARALARLPLLLEMAVPKLAPGGVCLFLKGATADAELTEAARDWHMQVEKRPSQTDPSAQILRISEIARAERA